MKKILFYSIYVFVAGVMMSICASCGSDVASSNNGNDTPKEEIIQVGNAVDLGLSVKWADMNVGATSATDYGLLYGWGNTDVVDPDDNLFDESPDTISGDSRYDIATAKWGGKWRMPLLSEWRELIDKCTWVLKQTEDRMYYQVTGPNGNSIDLGADGYGRLYGYGPSERNYGGYYWAGNRSKDSIINAYVASFNAFSIKYYANKHNIYDGGYSVRPVLGSLPPFKSSQEDIKKVDLGLSVKWANMNVGSKSPADYGGYYAWGETEEKGDRWYIYYKDGWYQNIGTNISGTDYDVAHVKWGGEWRMPTKPELQELKEKCTWWWTSSEDSEGSTRWGYKVTGPNGNSIFLPAAGYRVSSGLVNTESGGYYWSSWYSTINYGYARYLFFNSGGSTAEYNGPRDAGQSVRPVCP